ncbi:MAG: ABC transporter permease [Oscillospiraceae bacterium]|nr:ABC transporter permease [Oscillospiraceae bacterium]MCI8807592.1 ABC transporter permease [Oscillospiraceae bacterium]MCI9549014.1 ABC transporter permease [Oscillospiraceae bacterium]
MRRLNIGYFIKEGFSSIFSHGLMSFAAVCMIVACLIIMGSFSLLAVNVDEMLSQLEEENEFLAFIDEDYTDDQIRALMEQVRQIDNVDPNSVTFVSREQAKRDYLRGHESEGLYVNMPDEVLRDRLSIRVLDLERFSETVEAVKALPGVANHRAASEVAEGFVAVRNAVTALAYVLIGILAAVSLFIISNTTRLAAFSRREEIAIMKMCGATDGFVRWPFIVEGLILGIMGALVAFFLQWAVYAGVCKALVGGGAVSFFALMDFKAMWKGVLGVFLTSGSIIGALGSSFAIRKFLQV